MSRPTEMMELSATCGQCGTTDSVEVPAREYELWQAGENIAVVFPKLSLNQRDILIGSDTTRPTWRARRPRTLPYYLCDVCWDKVMKEDE